MRHGRGSLLTGARSRRTRRLRGGLVALVLVALLGAPAAPAGAQLYSATVDCDTADDDIEAVQEAVDMVDASVDPLDSAPTFEVLLRGTCEFGAAPAHKGDETGIKNTAVLVREQSISDLVIRSDPNASERAKIVGSGDETAFAVAPGNDRVTIQGLDFERFARPIVVIGANDTTITDNNISANLSTDSAIVAVANGSSMKVQYGSGTRTGTPTFTGSTLTNLAVTDNVITYAPPGLGGSNDVIAVDVRQRSGDLATGGVEAAVDGVAITGNIMGMFASDFTSFGQNGIRVQGLDAAADHRIHGVEIRANLVGRLDGVSPGKLDGVDPDDAHAAGRVGIFLHRVDGFAITDNEVRARLSAVSTLPQPGGGIVIADSTNGVVGGPTASDGNDVVVLADELVNDESDLGAIGVLDDLFATGDQATGNIDVLNNTVGDAADGVGARRGIVVSGADQVTAGLNAVVASKKEALFIGADAEGPPPGQLTVRKTVTGGVFCQNTLDGIPDKKAEVSFADDASPASRFNAFPGGSRFVDNFGCTPTVKVEPAPVDGAVSSGGSLTVSGTAWASRPVAVTITDRGASPVNSVTKTATAGIDGSFSTSFDDALSPSELGDLTDGVVDVEVVVGETSSLQHTLTRLALLNRVTGDSPPEGDILLNDGGDGWSNKVEIVMGKISATLTAPALPDDQQVVGARLWWSDSGGIQCGPFEAGVNATVKLEKACGEALEEGADYHVSAEWWSDSDVYPLANDSSTKDTQSAPPTMTTTVGATNAEGTAKFVDFTGSHEPFSEITVTKKGPNGFEPFATATADEFGDWAVTAELSEGEHEVSAYAHDPAQNRSASIDPPQTVTIDIDTTVVDTTPPDPPVIDSSLDGTLQPFTFEVRGTAEAFATVRIFIDGQPDGETQADGELQSDGTRAFQRFISAPTGTHVIDAVAIDEAGNVSAKSNQVTVQVDAKKPVLEVDTPDRRIFGPDETVTITGTAADNLELLTVTVDYRQFGEIVHSETASPCNPTCGTAGPVQWTSSQDLGPGIYGIDVTVTDLVGNRATKHIKIFKV